MNIIKLKEILEILENKYQKSYEEYLFIDIINALLQDSEINILENSDVGKTESSD